MGKVIGFDVEQTSVNLKKYFNYYFLKARSDLLKEFSSAGYSNIIKNFTITNDMQNINIILQDDINSTGQDFIELLAQGGTLKKKDGSTIAIKPSYIVRKYLGKR